MIRGGPTGSQPCQSSKPGDRMIALTLMLGGLLMQTSGAAIEPPAQDFRHVERVVEGASRFDLVRSGKPAFSIVVTDPNDVVLSTAAQDLARYTKARWNSAPAISAHLDAANGNL